jgi:hypothetical protein
MIIFGIGAMASVSISKASGFQCSGSIDPFKLGPLSVSGATGPQAKFDLCLTEEKQHGTIDGMISIFGLT